MMIIMSNFLVTFAKILFLDLFEIHEKTLPF